MSTNTTELETVEVNTGESLPVKFNPVTHEVSAPIENNDGTVFVYIRPKEGTSVEVGG